MKLLITLILAAAPVYATEAAPVPQEMSVQVEMDPGDFSADAEGVSVKVRRLISESRRDRQIRELNSPRRDPEAAQRALDALAAESPELAKKEAHSFSFHQGSIQFWRGDIAGANKYFDTALQLLMKKYPDGVPQGKFAEKNASFVSDIYMGRGTTAMILGRDADAIKDMTRAIEVTPRPKAFLHYNRCRALVRTKQYKAAAADLDAAYRIDAGLTQTSGDRVKICAILSKNGLQSQACQSGN